MLYVWATTNFARDRIVKIANRINGEFLWIFVPELTVGLQSIASVGLVVFVMNNLKVSLNPFVDLVFDLLLFFWGELAIKIEVEAKTFGGDVAPLLADVRID